MYSGLSRNATLALTLMMMPVLRTFSSALTQHRSLLLSALFLIAPAIAGGCEEKKPPPKILKQDQSLKVDPVVEVKREKAKKPPAFTVDESGARVGYELFLVDRPNGIEELKKELDLQKDYVAGKELTVSIERKAKLPWVQTFLSALEEKGASGFVLKSKTRPDYPKSLNFATLSSVKDAPQCSVVTMIQEGGTTATWTLAGGKARQRKRGLGGPDLSTTASTIESVAKACKKSDVLFVSADPVMQWGLVYDLAASTAGLEDASFGRRVLLPETPTVGKKVNL